MKVRVGLGREELMEFFFNVFLIVKYIMYSHVYKTHTFIRIYYIHIYVHFKV